MSEMMNLYATWAGTRGFRPTTTDEMEILTGLYILMGSIKLPRVRMYWSPALLLKVAEVSKMSMDSVHSLALCQQL